jgi:hypothetical protein
MTITYQQAKRIRKTGWLDLISDQLMYEKKVSTAVGKAISLKTRGAMKGITQKFDPLNIARMMTFGSSIGPALLGHWTGRSAQDIQYFSKRYKPIREKHSVGDKLTKLGGTGGFDAGSNQVLHKIYSLLSNSYEMDKKRIELAKNREEEHEIEDQKKHKELLEALQGKTTLVKIKDNGETPTDKKEASLMDKFLDFMKVGGTIFGAIRQMIQKALGSVMSWMLKRIGTLGRFLVSLMSRMGKFLFNVIGGVGSLVMKVFKHPVFLAVMAAGAAAYGIKTFMESLKYKQFQMDKLNAEIIGEYEMLTYEQNRKVRSPEDEEKRLKTIAGLERNISNMEIQKSDLEAEINTLRKSRPMDEIITEKLNDIRSLFDVDNPFDFDFDFEKFTKTPDVQISEDFSGLKISNDDFDMPPVKETLVPNFNRTAADLTAAEQGRMAEGKLERAPVATTQNVTTPTTPATTVEAPSIENSDTRMQNRMSTTVSKTQTNNSTVNQGPDGIPIKRPIPSCRNMEETFFDCLVENISLPN